MLSVIIPNTAEPTVIKLTYDNLARELQQLVGTELIVADTWLDGINKSTGDFICLVEPDCLVSSGYFASNMGLFKKNNHYRKLAMLASCIGIDKWDNRVFNYQLHRVTQGNDKLALTYWVVGPNRKKAANKLYPVQVGFVGGAIFRRQALLGAIKVIDFTNPNLVSLSTQVSFHFWNTNRRVEINPNTTYVSTDHRLETPGEFDPRIPQRVANIFQMETIV